MVSGDGEVQIRSRIHSKVSNVAASDAVIDHCRAHNQLLRLGRLNIACAYVAIVLSRSEEEGASMAGASTL